MNKSPFILGLAALLMVGCAGSASLSGLTDPVTNAVQGQAALDAAMELPTEADPVQQLNDAVYKLNTAYGQAPTPERGAGLAIAMAAKTANDLATLFGTSITRGSKREVPAYVSKLTSLLNPWKYHAKSEPISLLDMAKIAGEEVQASRAFPDSPTPVAVRTALEATTSDLQRALEIVKASYPDIEGGSYTISDPNQSGARARIGKAELLLLMANLYQAIYFLKSVQSFSIQFSSSEFSSSKTLEQEFGSDNDSSAVVSASRILPNGFLNSTSNGNAMRTDARFSGEFAISSFSLSANEYRDRDNSATTPRWLLTSIGINGTQITEQRDSFEDALTGSGPTQVNGRDAIVNLGGFLNTPGVTLQSFVPDFTVAKNGSSFTFTPVANSTKSAQVNALFPNGVTYAPVTLAGSKTRLDLAQAFLDSLSTN